MGGPSWPQAGDGLVVLVDGSGDRWLGADAVVFEGRCSGAYLGAPVSVAAGLRGRRRGRPKHGISARGVTSRATWILHLIATGNSGSGLLPGRGRGLRSGQSALGPGTRSVGLASRVSTR